MKSWNDMTEKERQLAKEKNDQLERNSILDGIRRYQQTISIIDPTNKKPEKVLIGNMLSKVAKKILREQQNLTKGKAITGNPSSWANAFLVIKAERLALLVLSHMLQSPKQVSSVLCREVGEAVRNEIMLDSIRSNNKQKTTNQKGFSRNDDKRFIGKVKKIQKIYAALNGGGLKWKLSAKLSLGAKLIECVIDATGGWRVEVEFIKKNISKAYVTMDDELIEWLNKFHADLESMRPLKMPMTCPPVEWGFRDEHGMLTKEPTEQIDGGYRILKEDFLTGAYGQHEVDMKSSSLNQVFEAVNHIQNTEWQIDKDTLEVLEHILSLNSPEYGNIIPVQPVRPKFPPMPTDTKERRLWYQQRATEKSRWYSATSNRIAAIKCLDVARNMKENSIWFPCCVDFRGRMYSFSSHLSPQGNDIQKSLLRFRNGMPIGNYGLVNLKIYAATVAGQDKMSYDNRVKWFDDMWLPVLKAGKFDPFADKRWVDYENPLIFLQVLRDIEKAIRLPDPSKFVSNLSVTIDGSQNGLQHLSAIMRDEIGGKSVNLIDNEVPSDLYMDVANKVRERIEADVKANPTSTDKFGNPSAHLAWHPKFVGDKPEDKKRRRSIVKRSVLAYPYGITIRGMHDNLIADGFTDGMAGSQYHNANYLAIIINEAVKDVVIQAAVLMDYLREIASILGSNGYGVSWTTPLGLPINQRYMWEESRVVRTCLHFTTFYVPDGNKRINVPAQVRGIVANVIHSLDASHAGYVALEMKDEKMNSVQFIHDSIGTHVCHIPRLHQIIRKTFVNMHRINLLEDFVNDIQKKTGVKLPPLPHRGKLNLDCVYKSTWFFA